MPTLPATGRVEYNGIAFGPYTSSECSSKPLYSQDGRTIIAVTHTITVKSKIYAAAGGVTPADTTMENVRRALTKPSAKLYYNGKGFGNNLTINTGSGTQDLKWGPKPQLLSFKSKGGLVAEVVWVCEVCIWECTVSVNALQKMEVNTRINWAIDESGYTRQTYSGFVRIPGWRAGGQQNPHLAAVADQIRESMVPPLALGFRREQNFSLSDDKSRLDFEVIDTELDGMALPKGCVHARASHTVQTVQGSLLQWVGTIQADYEAVRSMPRNQAWKWFNELANSRIRWSMLAAGQNGAGFGIGVGFGQGGPPGGGALLNNADVRFPVIPLSYTLSEPDVYGRNRGRFSVVYTFGSSVGPILARSGLFFPVPGERDLLGWRTSLANDAHHPRGNAKLRFDPRQDAIISICDGTTNVLASGAQVDTARGSTAFPFGVPCPPPLLSFLHYQLRVRVQFEDNVAELKTLPQTRVQINTLASNVNLTSGVPSQSNQQGALYSQSGGYGSMYAESQPGATLQVRTSPSCIITLIGSALRTCYPITPPSLRHVGGIPATPYFQEGDGFETWLAHNFILPVVAAKWRLSWILPQVPPGFLGVPPNPQIGV